MYVRTRRDESGTRRGVHRAGERYPWQLGVSAGVWVLLGVVLLSSGTGTSNPSADPEQVDQIAGSIGSDTVVSSTNSGHGALWIIAGVSVCILGGLLAIGQGWARYILVCLGAASIVSLALAASWLALPAMAVLVLASVLVLAPRTHRYLQ